MNAPNIVNTLLGFCDATGMPGLFRPVMMLGIEMVVVGEIAVALRYQTDRCSRRAKLGNAFASIVPSLFMIEIAGNSSNETSTTGPGCEIVSPLAACTSDWKTRDDAGLALMNKTKNTIGAGDSHHRFGRKLGRRSYHQAASTPSTTHNGKRTPPGIDGKCLNTW
jgi:hypothetical protein